MAILSTVDYPTGLPTDAMLDILIGYIRGTPVNVPQAVKVGWNVLGFGLSLGFPIPPQAGVAAMSKPELADALESLKGGSHNLKGFNWLVLIPMLLDLLQQLFPKS